MIYLIERRPKNSQDWEFTEHTGLDLLSAQAVKRALIAKAPQHTYRITVHLRSIEGEAS